MSDSNTSLDYASLGASATKEDVAFATRGLHRGEFPGAFCHIAPDLAGDPEYCCALHADGAGTKAAVAYLLFRKYGECSWFRGIGHDSAVMNLDDLACVGATDVFLLSNTISRNSQRIPREVLHHVVQGYVQLAQRMRPYGIEILMAGGETADVGDLVSTLTVDSTVAVRLPRRQVVDASRIQPGNMIVGVASSGRASYEEQWNSGIGSNGLTLARHALLSVEYAAEYPETVSSALEPSLAYGGPYKLEDPVPGTALTVGEALLSPARTYLPLVRRILGACADRITGLVHCSGGGLIKSKSFGNGLHFVKDRLFEMPHLFQMIRSTGRVAEGEMYKVFNMGHRLEIYCEPRAAQTIIDHATQLGVEARVIGEVLRASGDANEVSVAAEGKTYSYR